MKSSWQSNFQKGMLLGTIGTILCSSSVMAGQKIAFSDPTFPIGGIANADPRKEIIQTKNTSLFASPNTGISPVSLMPSQPQTGPSQPLRSGLKENSLFPTTDDLNSKFLDIDAKTKNDSSLSKLKDPKESALSRAWSSSTTEDPWNDTRSSSDSKSADKKNSSSDHQKKDRDNSLKNLANKYQTEQDRSSRKDGFSDGSYGKETPYDNMGLVQSMSQMMGRLADSREDLQQQTMQREMTRMFNNMRSSTSPIGGMDVTNAVHDSMWSMTTSRGNGANSQQPDLRGPLINSRIKSQAAASSTPGSFSSIYSAQAPIDSPANSIMDSSSRRAPNQPVTRQAAPSVLPIPKRPGQPF